MAESCLIHIDDVVRKLKSQITKHQFDSIADEVYFFKELKPKFIAEFLFYQHILTLESEKPHNGKKLLQKFYLNEIRKLEIQYDDDKYFYNYYIREATYLDHKYFVRHSYDLKMKLPQQLHNFDHEFTTSHDHKVATILGNQKITSYMNDRITELQTDQWQDLQKFKKLEWSSSKVNLVELIYGLHHSRCFNAGTIELSETIKIFERLLDIDLNNFHKIVSEIKSRKNNRIKFLQLLQENLSQFFIDTDA
ncbi:RteC domain-containing protein [Epilithonimonas ginsengisoli]|uniref:RteC domain-containing protein n=1 Tax=Epilithonimonas ginsengisoli TaxID=1245592 RepID=A0ABU4JIM8_9FLAO|nr:MULTISPECIES: RteC domain-containing protein [Chryseobacterium group]MBV6878820.1 RteC domain-containing protein [Epilithonimonas sp. FP105]MDW8549423.1 RteC domain-containing protein [Epilithonimonas ginsengisoli]